MAVIIKDRNVVADCWRRLESGPAGNLPAAPPAGDIIVPLVMWQGQRKVLLARAGRLGVWFASHEEPAEVAEDLRLFGVVAVNFPAATDGRGYSIGRLVRERYGYKGELRAIGHVTRDQLFQLAGCGFNSFALREGDDPHEALAAFGDFSETYQATVGQPLPLFRRRHPDHPGTPGRLLPAFQGGYLDSPDGRGRS